MTDRQKVVLDTNIYISALLLPDSNPGKIIRLAINGYIEAVISPQILSELKSTLKRKFQYTENEAEDVIKELRNTAIVVNPIHSVSNICGKESDHRVLECAVSSGVNFLVSGDKKHLLSLKKYEDIEILSPAEFLSRIIKF